MTTHVTPIVKPEERQVHLHFSLQETTMLALATSSVINTLVLPDDWKSLLTQISDDCRAATETITKG